MAERMGDTRTSTPCIYNGKPWGLDIDAQFGLDAGNFKQIQANAGLTWQQNFDNVSYYIHGDYSYLGRDWQTIRHRATGAIRTDIHLAKLSDTWNLNLPIIATAAYDNLMGLEPRTTLGGGLWLDYKDPKKVFYNGLSLFFVEEYERGGGFPDKWNPTLSVREFFKVKAGDLVKFTGDAFFVQSITNGEDFRVSFNPALQVALNKVLSLKFAAGVEYTNLPRNPSLEKYDLSTTIGLNVNLTPEETN